MKRYWQYIVNSTEKVAEAFLKGQVMDTQRWQFGMMDNQVSDGKRTIYMMTDALCLYFSPESRYYKDTELFEAVKRGLGFIEKWQRPDGSLDYPTCNFYSAPDTSFCFRRLYGAYEILRKYGSGKEEEELQGRYLKVILRCIPIIMCGGFHTPNHRWAVLAALLTLAKLTEENGELAVSTVDFGSHRSPVGEIPVTAKELAGQLRARAGQYLSEGIDGDADGEYAERSTGNYNAVVDKSLILAYEMTGDESFLGYVERNLDMMLYYIDGDDTIFTQNSTRQDQGKALYPDQYFYLYTYMADKTGSEAFDAAAHKMIKDSMARGEGELRGKMQGGDIACGPMYIFMMYDWLKGYTFKGYGYLEEYRRYFGGSQVLRVKKKDYVCSVLNNKASFLFVKFGALPVGLRIGEAYCDVRNVIPREMEVTEDGCVLHSTARGWYYQPFAEPQGTSDWWAMDHKKRELVVTSQVDTTITIKELEKGVEVTVKTEGLDGLPLRVELDIPAGSVLENDAFCLTAGKGESLILRDGCLKIHNSLEKILVGPGYGTHAFKGHYSGEDKNSAGYSIFFNEYTPYEKTFRIVKEG